MVGPRNRLPALALAALAGMLPVPLAAHADPCPPDYLTLGSTTVSLGGTAGVSGTPLVNLVLDTPTVEDALTVGTQGTTQGVLTIAGPGSGATGGKLTLSNISGGLGVTLGNGSWNNSGSPATPVAYFRPNTSGKGTAFDLMPNGSAADSWEDICSTDITADATNWECTTVRKYAGGRGSIGTKANGTGTVRPLAINEAGGNVTVGSSGSFPKQLTVYANGGSLDGVQILGTTNPALSLITNTASHVSYLGLATSAGQFCCDSGINTATGDLAGLNAEDYIFTTGLGGTRIANLAILHNNDVEIGGGVVVSTGATGGFFALPTMNGVPSGTPTHAATGFAHCVVDYADGKLECYVNGGWQHLTFASGT
jgi:hypothetical protein